MASRTVTLQGDPGSGKTMMMCITAVQQPVHVIDFDRKIASAGWAQPGLKDGKITLYEISEPIDRTNLSARTRSLVGNKRPDVEPQGWRKFADYVHSMFEKRDSEASKAGTIGVDSLTLGSEHLKTQIMYLANKGKFQFDQWNALKVGWMDTWSTLRDLCRTYDKDLIMTVHERHKLEPGEKTTGGTVEKTVTLEGEVRQGVVYTGSQDLAMLASLDGQAGSLIGAQCDEYYHLYVDVADLEKPVWKCRVWPDGKRNLRTSFSVTKAVHEPDFRKIWK